MRYLKVFGLIYTIALLVNLALYSVGYAQDAAPVAEPAWKQLLNMFVISVLPALWAAVGPMATAAITKGVNSVSNAYVPRPLQVVLSGAITAVLAGLAGDPVAVAGVAGATGQVLAATKPETLRTSAPES